MTAVSVLKSNQALPSSIASIAGGLSAQAAEILESRGLDLELIARLGWRSSTRSKNGEVWIDIPYFRKGVEVNTKHRSIGEHKGFSQTEGGEQCLYNLDSLDGDGPFIITEGEMDCVVALQCGYAALSVPGGAPAQRGERREYPFLSELPRTATVILAVDSDEPGKNLLHALNDNLGGHRCKYVTYPAGCKDLNDVLLKHGTAGVRSVIDGAKFMLATGVYTMSELPPSLPKEAHQIGFVKKLLKFRRREVCILTGLPGHGKSLMMNAIAADAALKSGWRACFASFEHEPQHEQRRDFRSMYIRKPPERLTPDDIVKADKWIEENFSFILKNDDEAATLSWLLEKMAQAVIQKGADILVVDPFNQMEHDYNFREMNEHAYIGFALTKFTDFAKRYNVSVWILAHPNKMRPTKQGDAVPIPGPSDVSGSSHWFNKSFWGGTVYRDPQKNILFQIWKLKDWRVMGETAQHTLRFNDYTFQYEDKSDEF